MRTNIVIDEDLVSEVMRTFGLESRRAAVDFALRVVLGRSEQAGDAWSAMLRLEGVWADMTAEEARDVYDSDASDDPR